MGVDLLCSRLAGQWPPFCGKGARTEVPAASKIYPGTYLAYNDFSGLDLSKTNFDRSILIHSKFTEAILVDSSFNTAELEDTDFVGSDLRNNTAYRQQ